MDTIINKVSESGLITIDLEEYFPREDIIGFDLKDHLFMGMILKEKDFRASLQATDWNVYKDQYVAVFCSADAIIPLWAYMLVSTNLNGVAKRVLSATPEEAKQQLFLEKIRDINVDSFTDKRVVIKGCGELSIGEAAYVEVTNKLVPLVRSLMYGEPCSTVPVFKRK